jgi:peptidoglycan/xylan/chitin deacetylase (PgdA/CDA1 family)
MDVIIVCHTEFGHVVRVRGVRYVVPVKSSVAGVEKGVKSLARLADTHGAKVTFAVMPETAQSFPEVGNGHEIGLHVHAGWMEPELFGARCQVGDSWLRAHSTQSADSIFLPDHSFHEQLDMIQAGKEHILKCLQEEPKAFVAGLWSINNDTVRALVEAGISHECSGVAHTKNEFYDWSQLPRICMPYYADPDDYQLRGNLPLLMVPISQMLVGSSVNPEHVPLWGLSWLKACFAEYYAQNLPVFHICLHSPSMTDPFFVDALNELLLFIRLHKDVEFKWASEIEEHEGNSGRTKLAPYLAALNKTILMRPLPRIRDVAGRITRG